MRFGIVLYTTLLAHPSTASVLLGRVVGVSDGDTITVLDSGKRQHKVWQDILSRC
jgi:hypothetical protein